MQIAEQQIAEIIADVKSAIQAEDAHVRLRLVEGVEMACHSLLGQERVVDGGPWTASADGRTIQSDNFHHDVTLQVKGDFYSDADRLAYSVSLANALNGRTFTLPKEPPISLLHSMALRYRHDFGLDADDSSPMACGMTPEMRLSILALMRQLYEEVAAHTFVK